MKIRVTPNAKTFSVSVKDGVVSVRVAAKPEDGKANRETEKKLSKLLGARATITKGLKSRDKEIVFDGLTDEQAINKLLTQK